jgi:hypothetical protein
MTPKELAQRLEDQALKSLERFTRVVIATQENAYGEVVVVLKKLSLDQDGYIQQTAENRAILRQANRAFQKGIDQSGYLSGLNRFTVTFSLLDEINEEYFNTFPNFKTNRLFMKDLQKQAIKEIEATLLNQGLEAQIKIPLSQVLNQNVNSGGSFSAMLDQVRNFIKGTPENEGKLLRYAKQITKDVLFNYSRTYQQAVSSDLGLEFYMYSGGLMDKTRKFCEERAGKFFHQKEIEQWAAMDWQGKRPGTTESSIFVYAGGHNCLHQIIPVSVIVVPKEDIQRAIQQGYYKVKKAAAVLA